MRREAGNGIKVHVMDLRRGPAASHINPFVKTAALLALDVHDVGVTAASTADTVLLHRIRSGPILVLLNALPLILRGFLEVRFAGELTSRSIGRAMLNRGVPVTKITEVMNVTGGKEGTGSQGMNGSISPLVGLLIIKLKPIHLEIVHLPVHSRIHRSDPSY